MSSKYLCLAAAAVALTALPARSQTAAPEGPKTAEQQFKNIQALKGQPADQVFPAMQFMAASLGVECEFCHVQGKFESDDKRSKLTARKMISMTLAINKDNFNGRREVTCYTCHRGNEEPTGIPPVVLTDEEPKHEEEAETKQADMPAVDQILAKYVTALGGAEAIHKSTSRVAKGSIAAGGHDSPIEVYMKAPDKRVSITHMGNGDSITAFDGTNGWMSGGAHPAREMRGSEITAAKMDADFYFPTHLKEVFSGFRVGRPDKVGDRPAWQVIAMQQGQPPVRLFFDKESGLLLRQVRYADTPVGRNPTQIDYADYRAVDGAKVPFRWTLSRVNGRFTIQVKEMQANVPIDDSKFVKP